MSGEFNSGMKYNISKFEGISRLGMYGKEFMEDWITYSYYRMAADLEKMEWSNVHRTRYILANSWSKDYFLYLYNRVGKDYRWWYGNYMDDNELEEYLTNPIGRTFITLMDNGEPAGFGIIKFEDSWDCNLEYFGIVKQSMGKGLGKKFLLDVMQYARLTRKKMWLYTTSLDSPAALPNYQSCGFKIIEKKLVQEYYPIHSLQG